MNSCPYRRDFLWKCFALPILWVLFFCCAKFHKNLWKEFRDILEFPQKGYKLCMNWRLDLTQTNLLLFGSSWRVFITHSFCKWPLYTVQPAECKYTCTISKKKHENVWISQMQCRTLFVISEVTFTKTAIKPKFSNRFSSKKNSVLQLISVLLNPQISCPLIAFYVV